MGIYIDLQSLCRSLDDDIVLRRDSDFATFLGFDRDDRMKRTVFVRRVVSIGVCDDGFREILFDRCTISEVPSKRNNFITSIIEHGRRCIKRNIERISTYG